MITKILSFTLLLSSACAHSGKYARKEWKYPVDEDRDCQNTRAEILIARSKKPVTFRDAKGCKVLSGEWDDFYYPETVTDARKVQIDHVVPLKNANETGGAKWSRQEKKRFANDPENLVVTTSRTNQQKGAKDLRKWLPASKPHACRYYKQWMHVKAKYNLVVTPSEQDAVTGCP